MIATGVAKKVRVAGYYNLIACCDECGRTAIQSRMSRYCAYIIEGRAPLCDECHEHADWIFARREEARRMHQFNHGENQ